MKKSAGYEAGLAMRKQVLGPDYVEQTLKNADPLLMPFQDLLTEFAWGSVWTRPGLDLKTRSMLTLAMCIALNRPHEIKLHLRGAVRNGCTAVELRELLLHSFIYCGGPAAVDAFNVMRTAMPEIEKTEQDAREQAGKAARPQKARAAAKSSKKGA